MNTEDRTRRLLPVIHSLGGCGGTLLAKCLACMPGIVLLSETNPASALLFEGRLNPLTQVAEWYPDLLPDVRVEGVERPEDLRDPEHFRAFIAALDRAVRERGQTLVLRDYNYIDYFGVPFETPIRLAPSIRSALEGSFRLKSAVLVRHPLPQFDSLRSHRSAGDVLSPDIYLHGYETFLHDFASAHVIKYEDIVQHAFESIEALCRYLELPFSPDFVDRFKDYHSVTGNLGREYDPTIAYALWEPEVDTWRVQLQGDPRYAELVERLGYAEKEAAQRSPSATDADVDVLLARLKAQEGEIRRLRIVADRELELRDVQAAAEDRKVALEALEAEYEALQRIAEERLAELVASQRASETMQQVAEERLRSLDAAQAENRDLRTVADQRLEELEKAQSSNAELRAENEALVRTAEERLTALDETRAENEALVRTAEERLAALDEIRAENESLQRVAEERLTSLERTQAENAAMRAVAEERLAALERSRAENDLLRQATDERAEALESMRIACETTEQAAEERLAALEQSLAEIDVLRQATDERAAALESLSQACEMVEQAAEERLAALNEALRGNAALQAECEMFEHAANERLAALDESEADNEALRAVARERLSALDQVQAENQALRDVAEERLIALNASNAENQALLQVADERLKALDDAMREMQALAAECAMLRAVAEERLVALQANHRPPPVPTRTA